MAPAGQAPAVGFDSWYGSVDYTGSAGAVAGETQREYAHDAPRAHHLPGLRAAIAACGLTRRGTGQPELYEGRDRTGATVRVTVEYGDRWIRLVQIRPGTR
ncbi:hypothetical protein [Streptomyces sp. SGAir0957]